MKKECFLRLAIAFLIVLSGCDSKEQEENSVVTEEERSLLCEWKPLYLGPEECVDCKLCDEPLGHDYEKNLPDLNCKVVLKEGEDEYIYGKWQLVVDYSSGSPVDVSCDSVFYTFYEGNCMLIINSNNTESKHDYTFSEWPYCPLCLPGEYTAPNFTIDGVEMYCEVLSSVMYVYDFCVASFTPPTNTGILHRPPSKNIKTFYRVE